MFQQEFIEVLFISPVSLPSLKSILPAVSNSSKQNTVSGYSMSLGKYVLVA
jgi:hypothetical protein